MISLPIGAIFTFLVFLFSMGIGNLPLYFNPHSILIVFGGTLALLFFGNPSKILIDLVKELRMLWTGSIDFSDARETLVRLAKDRGAASDQPDELIDYAKDLWAQGIAQDLFVVLLSQKRTEIEQRSVDVIQCLKNLAKYPPALGMAGTVMGIVTLFQVLDAGKDKVGPGLAMAMTATFFGLILANGIIMPLADRLQVVQMAKSRYLQAVYQIVLLINSDEPLDLIEDEVKLRAS